MQIKRIDYNGPDSKISKIILEEYPEIGYSYLYKLLRNSDVKLNGKRIKSDCQAESGDVIEFYCTEKPIRAYAPETVYEDENIIVFYKPKKISSQGKNSFEEKIKSSVNKNYILCHRLDTNTDGLILFAKNNVASEEIKNLFKTHGIEKHYRATVFGRLTGSGIFKDYLLKNSELGRVFIYDNFREKAKEAVLAYEALKIAEDTTVLNIKLITGRTHQIRAQFAYHGYPIVGDGKYGREELNRRVGVNTQKLTAYKLVFNVKKGMLKYLDKKIIMLDSSYL